MKRKKSTLRAVPPSRQPATRPVLQCWVYFVGWREPGPEVAIRPSSPYYGSMILRIPGPVRTEDSLRKIESLILGAARERKTPASVTGKVEILNLSLLEVFDQPLTAEDLAEIKKRNEAAAKQQEIDKNTAELIDKLASSPTTPSADQ